MSPGPQHPHLLRRSPSLLYRPRILHLNFNNRCLFRYAKQPAALPSDKRLNKASSPLLLDCLSPPPPRRQPASQSVTTHSLSPHTHSLSTPAPLSSTSPRFYQRAAVIIYFNERTQYSTSCISMRGHNIPRVVFLQGGLWLLLFMNKIIQQARAVFSCCLNCCNWYLVLRLIFHDHISHVYLIAYSLYKRLLSKQQELHGSSAYNSRVVMEGPHAPFPSAFEPFPRSTMLDHI